MPSLGEMWRRRIDTRNYLGSIPSKITSQKPNSLLNNTAIKAAMDSAVLESVSIFYMTLRAPTKSPKRFHATMPTPIHFSLEFIEASQLTSIRPRGRIPFFHPRGGNTKQSFQCSGDCKDESGEKGRCVAGAVQNYTKQLLTIGSNDESSGKFLNKNYNLLFLSP